MLDDELVSKAKRLAPERTLSRLLNRCLAEWVASHDRRALEERLAREYEEGTEGSAKVAESFDATESEGWPSW